MTTDPLVEVVAVEEVEEGGFRGGLWWSCFCCKYQLSRSSDLGVEWMAGKFYDLALSHRKHLAYWNCSWPSYVSAERRPVAIHKPFWATR